MGERNTVQKQIILDTLKRFDAHPSVDELHAEIKKSHPAISKATVYRNLKQLAEKGVVMQIAVANDVARYDGGTDFHHHFICDVCGGVYDIDAERGEAPADSYARIQKKYGFAVERSMTSFFGMCAACRVPLTP
ncbi:MAG: transcriptional repressor [Defluviitaleaceae bacterium]|nr:transcriptional repressor [Defluviitaleaceae bacterium]MCL2239173.1 transcriptional repressor [Defluviitaleaceae bacterium]